MARSYTTIGFPKPILKGPVITIIPRYKSKQQESPLQTNVLVENYDTTREIERWRSETRRLTMVLEDYKSECYRLQNLVEHHKMKSSNWRKKYRSIRQEFYHVMMLYEELKEKHDENDENSEIEEDDEESTNGMVKRELLDMVNGDVWREITCEEVKSKVEAHPSQNRECSNTLFDERLQFVVDCWNNRLFEKKCEGIITSTTVEDLKDYCLKPNQLRTKTFRSQCLNQYLAIIGGIRALGLCKSSK